MIQHTQTHTAVHLFRKKYAMQQSTNARQQGVKARLTKEKKSHPKIIITMIFEILSPIAEEPRVCWADTLVESVHTRPRTLPEEVPDLFYSRADVKRFEREAEMEPAPSLSPRRVRWADAVVTEIPVISKRRIIKARRPVVGRRVTGCFIEEMELAHPRAKRSRIAPNEEFFGQVCAQLMAVSPVGDSEDESDSEDDGSDLFFLDNSGSDDESLKLSYSDSEDESDSEDDGSEWYFSLSPISDNSGYSEDDDVDNRPDDLMDISGDLPLLSISGAAREVPPRETSAKGRRLRKELESSLDGCYWAMRLATRR